MNRHWQILAIVLVLGLTGCAGGPQWALVSEDDVPILSELKAAGEAQPADHSRIATQWGGVADVRVSLHETGNPAAERTVVLIHGCMSDHRTWRFVRGALGEEHRLILLDLPGCGDSDRPDPARLGPDGYGPDALAARALQALDAHLGHRSQNGPITLVGHSLGGAVVLRAMGSTTMRSRHDRLLRRVDRLVLLAPLDVEFVNPPDGLCRVADLSAEEIMLADVTGVLDRKLAEATCCSVDDHSRALRQEADRVGEILRCRDSRRAAQAILQQAIPHQAGRPDWPVIDAMTADYANIDVPCLLVWGAHDQTLPVAMGYKLQSQIPTAELHILDDCRHSPQLEHPLRCAEVIQQYSLAGPAWHREAEAVTLVPPMRSCSQEPATGQYVDQRSPHDERAMESSRQGAL